MISFKEIKNFQNELSFVPPSDFAKSYKKLRKKVRKQSRRQSRKYWSKRK